MRLSIALRQTEADIVKVLNNSGLPLDVMDMMLSKICSSVHSQAEEQYLKDLDASDETKEDK